MDLTFVLVPIAAVIAPLLAALVRKALVVPLVVFEIALGMALGPAGFGLLQDSDMLDLFSHLGLAMLFFMAGNEIDPQSVRGSSGKRALGGWVASAALAVAAAAFVADTAQSAAIIAIALTATALGTITPMLRDAGITHGALGRAVSAAGAVGEFLPLVAISVFLSGRAPIAGTISLVIFVAVAALTFFVSNKGQRRWLQRMVSATLRTSGQFAIRFVILLLAALVTLAVLLGIDYLLGAFTAGMLARVVLRDGDPAEQEVVEAKLESIAFGFFVPIFFVATGATFPLQQLFADRHALLLVPVFAVIMLIVRGLPAFLLAPRGSSLSDRRTVALFTATTLPLVIAVTSIGTSAGVLDESTSAALVGGGMLTVLLFPMLGLIGRSPAPTPNITAADDNTALPAHE